MVGLLYLLGLRTEVGFVAVEERFLGRFFCVSVDSDGGSFSFVGEVEGFDFFDAGELVGDFPPDCSVGPWLPSSNLGLLISEMISLISVDLSCDIRCCVVWRTAGWGNSEGIEDMSMSLSWSDKEVFVRSMGVSERWVELTCSFAFVVRGLEVFGWDLVEGAMVIVRKLKWSSVGSVFCVWLDGSYYLQGILN